MSGPSKHRPAPDSAAATPGAAVAGDTIAAIATAAGRSALATVRISGAQSMAIAAACVAPWPLEPRVATVCAIRDPATGALADHGVVTFYAAPRSFTGEDCVEVSTHGGAAAPAAVLSAFLRSGARQARPGEFTRRAVLHGKLDLLQAEAVGDLIDAQSTRARQAALAQLSGALSLRLSTLRDALLELEGLLAYDIDFPSEDDGPIARDRVVAAADAIVQEVRRVRATLPAAHLGRDGIVVVLAGVPNAGKSSLYNALLGEVRAIVTDHPGTTRDALESLVDADPYPWRLIDTAGLRGTSDAVEQLGVEVSQRWLARADVALVCGASPADRAAALAAIQPRSGATVIRVHTMCDRHAPGDGADVSVSAVTGEGLDALRAAIRAAALERHPLPADDAPVITRARHDAALAVAESEIEAFVVAWDRGSLPTPVAATHVRAAVTALEELVGGVDVEDVLSRVFSRFCVGK